MLTLPCSLGGARLTARPLVLRGALLDLDKFGTMDTGEDAHSSAMRRDMRALIVASPDRHVEVRVLVDESAAAIATYPYHLEAAGLALQAVTTAAVVTDTIERAARRAGPSAG